MGMTHRGTGNKPVQAADAAADDLPQRESTSARPSFTWLLWARAMLLSLIIACLIFLGALTTLHELVGDDGVHFTVEFGYTVHRKPPKDLDLDLAPGTATSYLDEPARPLLSGRSNAKDASLLKPADSKGSNKAKLPANKLPKPGNHDVRNDPMEDYEVIELNADRRIAIPDPNVKPAKPAKPGKPAAGRREDLAEDETLSEDEPAEEEDEHEDPPAKQHGGRGRPVLKSKAQGDAGGAPPAKKPKQPAAAGKSKAVKRRPLARPVEAGTLPMPQTVIETSIRVEAEAKNPKPAKKEPAAAAEGVAASGKAGAAASAEEDGGAASVAKPGTVQQSKDGAISRLPLRLASGSAAKAATRPKPASNKCKVFVIDTDDVGAELGLPKCDLSLVVAEEDNGTPKLNKDPVKRYKPITHDKSMNAALFFFGQALRKSKFHTTRMEEANVIFIYDYCYYMWWLAHTHSEWELGNLTSVWTNPGVYYFKIFDHIMATERFKRNNGDDWAVFESHVGFAHHEQAIEFLHLACEKLANLKAVVLERAQRHRCWSYDPSKVMIAPYTGLVEEGPKPKQRDIFIFFKARCTPDEFVGKRQRNYIVDALKDQADDIYLDCTDVGTWEEMTHKELVLRMFRSVFCLILAGDSQSSRRVTEVFMAGCIPLFIGPPWHTMPLADHIDYEECAVFLELTDSKAYMRNFELQPKMSMAFRARDGNDAQWWLMDDPTIPAPPQIEAKDILNFLRALPQEVVDAKLESVARQKSFFTFGDTLGQNTASDLIMDFICKDVE